MLEAMAEAGGGTFRDFYKPFRPLHVISHPRAQRYWLSRS